MTKAKQELLQNACIPLSCTSFAELKLEREHKRGCGQPQLRILAREFGLEATPQQQLKGPVCTQVRRDKRGAGGNTHRHTKQLIALPDPPNTHTHTCGEGENMTYFAERVM